MDVLHGYQLLFCLLLVDNIQSGIARAIANGGISDSSFIV